MKKRKRERERAREDELFSLKYFWGRRELERLSWRDKRSWSENAVFGIEIMERFIFVMANLPLVWPWE